MSLLIRNVFLNDSLVDVRTEGNRIQFIGSGAPSADDSIDAHGELAILPAFYNAHAHAAMTLLRGYADDMELFEWLSKHIWPIEAKLSAEDVYHGTRLAVLEMIRSGTVFFNDMYWRAKQALRAAEEMGVRACIGIQTISNPDLAAMVDNDWLLANRTTFSSRIRLAYAPHAIYTVPEAMLREIAEQARRGDDLIHMHLSETEKEFQDCLAEHGTTPTRFLDQCGLLTKRSIFAHCVRLTDDDVDLLAERGCVVVHNPTSNMKLCSGMFRYDAVPRRCRWTLGTDGVASNNNHSMLETMKLCALRAKDAVGDPKCMSAGETFRAATKSGAEAFGIDAGTIEVGKLADFILVDLRNERLVPNHNLISNMVYSADSSCVDTVVCDGRILMRERHVPHEEEIVSLARESAKRLASMVS